MLKFVSKTIATLASSSMFPPVQNGRGGYCQPWWAAYLDKHRAAPSKPAAAPRFSSSASITCCPHNYVPNADFIQTYVFPGVLSAP